MARSQRLTLDVARDRSTLTLVAGEAQIVLNRKQLLRVIMMALVGGIITDDRSLTLIAENCM